MIGDWLEGWFNDQTLPAFLAQRVVPLATFSGVRAMCRSSISAYHLRIST
jgi:hypothetical protein